MAPIPVHIKHAGKTYDLLLDPDLPPNVFKDAVYNATGVPVDRMKVMVKGGVLKVRSSSLLLRNTDRQMYVEGGLFLEKDRAQSCESASKALGEAG